MQEFTFGVITYNQENFVLDTLNSIKYQVQNFGNGISIDLVIADDCSSDATCDVIESWVEKNRTLFRNVEFLFSKTNRGIVKNFLSFLRAVKTEYFKVIAGDDIFFDNNIFDVFGNYNFVITPVIAFSMDNVVRSFHDSFLYKALLHQKKQDLYKFLTNGIKHGKYPAAPGVFYTHTLIDEKYYQYLLQYTWIEDVPTWNYFYNGEKIKPYVCDVPYVLYRCDVGISTNAGHSKREVFLQDAKRLNEKIVIYRKENKWVELWNDFWNHNKWLNPYAYRNKLMYLYKKYIESYAMSLQCQSIVEYRNKIPEYCERAKKHLELIRSMK